MSDEVHDYSRVDSFMASRRRAMLLNAIWKPMLAGAAGAALVIAAVWVVLPKISYREIVVPQVTMRDVTVPNIVPRDVQGEQSFFPAKVTPSGKIELDPSTADRVEDLVGDLGYCRPLPTGVYECIALHGGVEVPIRQTPITTRQGRPA